MNFTYRPFVDDLFSKGISLNQLRLKGVINQHTYEAMINDRPVNIQKVVDLAVYLNVPIGDIVEVIYGDKLSEQE